MVSISARNVNPSSNLDSGVGAISSPGVGRIRDTVVSTNVMALLVVRAIVGKFTNIPDTETKAGNV